jgi:hypothetical protein
MLKAELAKGLATCIQGEKNLNNLLNNQRMIKGKEGLGFVAKSSKKGISDWWPSPQRRRRRTRRRRSLLLLPPFLMFHLTFVTQRRSGRLKGKEKKVEETGVSGSKGPKSPASSSSPVSPAPKAGVSGPTHNNFAGKYNPDYVLLKDYYGDVYAKYVGPYDGYMSMLFGYLRFL